MTPETIDSIQATINDHNDGRGWDIENKAHGLHMLLCDLIEYADAMHFDFDIAVEQARETLRECA